MHLMFYKPTKIFHRYKFSTLNGKRIIILNNPLTCMAVEEDEIPKYEVGKLYWVKYGRCSKILLSIERLDEIEG